MLKHSKKAEFRNLLAILRVAITSNRAFVIVPVSKFKFFNMLEFLVNHGIIHSFVLYSQHTVIFLRSKTSYTN
jgi:hypothetical protein